MFGTTLIEKKVKLRTQQRVKEIDRLYEYSCSSSSCRFFLPAPSNPQWLVPHPCFHRWLFGPQTKPEFNAECYKSQFQTIWVSQLGLGLWTLTGSWSCCSHQREMEMVYILSVSSPTNCKASSEIMIKRYQKELQMHLKGSQPPVLVLLLFICNMYMACFH